MHGINNVKGLVLSVINLT